MKEEEKKEEQFDLVDEDALGRYTKQIEYLEIKANDLKETIRQIDLGGDTKGDVFKLEAELEEAEEAAKAMAEGASVEVEVTHQDKEVEEETENKDEE